MSDASSSGRDRVNMVNDVSAKVLTQYKRNKMKMLVSFFSINVFVFGVLTYFVLAGRRGLEDAYNRDLVIQEEAGNIARFDEILTMSCRMAVCLLYIIRASYCWELTNHFMATSLVWRREMGNPV